MSAGITQTFNILCYSSFLRENATNIGQLKTVRNMAISLSHWRAQKYMLATLSAASQSGMQKWKKWAISLHYIGSKINVHLRCRYWVWLIHTYSTYTIRRLLRSQDSLYSVQRSRKGQKTKSNAMRIAENQIVCFYNLTRLGKLRMFNGWGKWVQ